MKTQRKYNITLGCVVKGLQRHPNTNSVFQSNSVFISYKKTDEGFIRIISPNTAIINQNTPLHDDKAQQGREECHEKRWRI